jgi:quercetin dioxygenase-like cupin family protein
VTPPDSASILLFLRRFRGEDPGTERPQAPKRPQVFAKWTAIRLKKNRKAQGRDAFDNFLEGERKNPSYNDVMDLIEAHGFDCFDLFVDFFQRTLASDVRVIREADRSHSKIGSKEARMNRVDPTFLGGHRTKIEIVELPKDEFTDFHFHSGHEFVCVDRGYVRAEFKDCFGLVVVQELKEGDSVAFSSLVDHRFTNLGNGPARLIAARPSLSRPRDEQELDWFHPIVRVSGTKSESDT